MAKKKPKLTKPPRPIRLAPLSVTEIERDKIQASAAERGLSVAEFLRARALG